MEHVSSAYNKFEALALEGLRVTLWLAQARGQVRAAAAAWLREPDRMTLRVAYALHVLLERGEHEMAVPLYGDPLTSLGNSAVAQTLMTDLLGQLAALARADLMAGSRPEAARRRLAAAVQRVTENPYPRTDDQDELEARLRAAEREGLGPELVGALALSARSGSGQGRPGEERARIRTAGAALLSFLGGLLPDPHAAEAADTAAEGEGHTIASLPALPERGLHALNPARRLLQPDDSAHSLLLRLSGPPEAQWRGLPLMWRRAGEGWTVRLHTRDYRLSADPADQPDGVAVQFGAQPGLALLYGDYLLLTLNGDRAARRERLLHLLRLARAVAALLDPGGAYLNLRLARAAAALLRGDPVEPASVDVHSAERYAAVSEGALLEFARRGAGDLLLHLRPRPEEQVRSLFARAAALVGAPDEQGQALLHTLRVAALLEPDPSEPPGVPAPGETPALTRPGMVLSLPAQPEPLTVRFLGRALTLRPDYKGELAAVLPGRPAALVGDLLALPVAGSALLIVRQEDELLLSFQAAPAPGV